jgi:hypothetical protein
MPKGIKSTFAHLSFTFLLVLILLPSCGESDDPVVTKVQSANFDSSTLSGIYDITFASEVGIHVYEFDANGSVLIKYADGTTDTEMWSVNNSGQLAITGSVNDLFTLTSGDQFSGELNVILRDNDTTNETKTTGTIKRQ